MLTIKNENRLVQRAVVAVGGDVAIESLSVVSVLAANL
jgi:hypothetical protein